MKNQKFNYRKSGAIKLKNHPYRHYTLDFYEESENHIRQDFTCATTLSNASKSAKASIILALPLNFGSS